jgi:hypothetical protein
MLAAMLLRQHSNGLPISESHPKAMLWLLGIGISLGNLGTFLAGNTANASDHERDAALSALSAWAMSTQPNGWEDLYPQEPCAVSPLAAPLGYWMPQFSPNATRAAAR